MNQSTTTNSSSSFGKDENFEDEKIEIFYLIFDYLTKKGEKNETSNQELWDLLWKFLPSFTVFEFISMLKKNRKNEMKKKSILIDENNDNYLSYEKLSFIFNKFALKLN